MTLAKTTVSCGDQSTYSRNYQLRDECAIKITLPWWLHPPSLAVRPSGKEGPGDAAV